MKSFSCLFGFRFHGTLFSRERQERTGWKFVNRRLRALADVLHVTFPVPGEAAPTPPRRNHWRSAALALGALCVLLAAALLFALPGRAAPQPEEAAITGVYFFDEAGQSLRPDLGDGWHAFSPGSRVWMEVTFRDSPKDSVYAVSLFLTPTGTETFDLREQLAVQAIPDGRGFALFALDIPRDLMGHLDILLECGGGQTVTETLNITATPE